MKIKTLLLILFSTLFAFAAMAQAPNTFQMNKNKAIQFYNSADALDGTEIIRQGGNSLRFKYFGNNLTFDAIDDKLFQIRNSLNVPNIQLHPNGGKSFILGKLAVGADDSAIPVGFSFFVNGDIKATEVNAAFALENTQKIRFKDAAGSFDGTEINRTANNSLNIKYFGNPIRFDANDNQPFQIRNAEQTVNIEFDPNGGNSFILGKFGLGITTPQVLLDLNLPDADPKAIRFRRTSHPTYELRLASSKGLSIFNQTSSKYEMVFGGDGTVGIGENFTPQAYLHITQAVGKPYAIKLSRDEGSHTDYELFIGSSQGLNIKNSETGDIDMVFGGDKTIGIGTLTPTSPLHLKQHDERGLRFERDGHDMYDIGVKGSTGLWISNTTDSRQEMVFDGNGNVGIGTTAPTGKLHIEGDPSANDASLTGPGGYLVLGNTTGPNLALDNNEIMARNNGAIGTLGLQNDGGAVLIHGGANMPSDQRVHVSPTGEVGIGITPGAKLHVNGPSLLNGPENDGSTGTLKITTGTQSMILDANEIEGPTDSPIHINNLRDQDVRLADGGGNVIMNGSGLVGIGTGAPETKLHVEGTTLLKGPDSDGSTTGTLKILTGTQTMVIDANEIDGPVDGTLHINYHSPGNVNIAGAGGDVVVNGGGNVGIGTNSPSSILDIEKNFNGSTILEITNSDPGNLARGGISIGNGTPGSHFSLLSTSPNYDVVPGWQNSGILSTDSELLNGLVVRTSAGGIRFQPGGTTDKIVFDPDGNVGIGTDTPETKLTIKGESGIKLIGESETTTDDYMLIQPNFNVSDLNPGQTTGASRITGRHLGHLVIDITANDNDDAFAIRTDANMDGEVDRISMVVKPNGNVGIGTTSIPTDYKLAVDGKIISEEIKVQNSANWPDYVFEKDYPLLPLNDLEKSIQQNGHLPGMPSADEVKENGGVEVGDMQMRLLEKVEELTLYIIQLEKRIKELEQPAKN